MFYTSILLYLVPNSVLGMTLNCIQWWGSISWALGSVESLLHSHYFQVHSDSEWLYLLDILYELNRSVQKLAFDKNTWNHIIVYRLLVLDKHTWNHITVCKLFVLIGILHTIYICVCVCKQMIIINKEV